MRRYARMWPRKVFNIRNGGQLPAEVKKALSEPGVYVLYRDDHPYYVGKTGGSLFDRIWHHAIQSHGRYYNLWNFFSVFVVPGKKQRNEVEGILIAAMPTTANSANPKFRHLRLPGSVRDTLRKLDWISSPSPTAGSPEV